MDTCQDEIQFKWTPEMELFVVRQFAEVFKAAEIAENITKAYCDEYKAELLNYGKKEFCQFLLRRIHKLSPNHSQFPRQYQDPYDKWRREYLKDIDSSSLYHPVNRLRALDELYEKVKRLTMAATKPNEIRHGAEACLKILKAAAVESEIAKVSIGASTFNGNAKTQLDTYLQSLPQAKLHEYKEIQFKWLLDIELFVVRQFAEFVMPNQIAINITLRFYDECEADLLNYTEKFGDDGEKEFCKFLLRRIHKLSPNHSQFPKKYQYPYNEWRREYLKDIDSSFLYHPVNRLRALHELYEKVDESLMAAAKPNEIQHGMSACLEILKAAAVESEIAKVSIGASTFNGNAKIQLDTYLQSLPQAKLIELKGKIKRGESIEFPDWVETGYSLN